MNNENLEITKEIFEKVAIDMVSKLVLFRTTKTGYEEVSNEINSN